MSRRSLRLQSSAAHHVAESPGDLFHSHSSSSSSSYTSTRRETRTVRSRKQQATSGSLSLSLSQAATPTKKLCFSAASTPLHNNNNNNGGSSVTSLQESGTQCDGAHQLSSIQEQPHLRQRSVTTTTVTTTLVDGRWGHCDHASSSVNGNASVSKSHSSHANGYICRDCSSHSHSHRSDSFASQSSAAAPSQLTSQSAEASSDVLSSTSSSPFTSVYSRDRSRRTKTGVVSALCNACVRYSKRALAPVTSLVALLFSSVLWLRSKVKSPQGEGVLMSFSNSMRQTLSSSLSQLWLWKQAAVHRLMGSRDDDGCERQAHSSFCGSMNVKDLVTEDAATLKLNGSLCDDCKGKQHSETHAVLLTQSSRPRRLAGALWSLLACAGSYLRQPGHCVLNAGKALGSGAGSAFQKLLSLLWMLVAAPGKVGREVVWFLASGWYQFVSLMSVLNVFFLTRCLPKLGMLLLLLLPLLLLLAFWSWGPSTAALLAYLPAINLTEWSPASSLALLANKAPASATPTKSAPVATPEAPFVQTAATPASQAPPIVIPASLSAADLERLERVERQLALLWERVQQGDQKQDVRHGDILGLYNTLKEQLHTETDKERLGLWVSALLDQRLAPLRGELEQESALREKSEEEQKRLQESEAARLAELELLLKVLAAKTEEVQQKQQQYEHERLEKAREESAAPAAEPLPVSVGVKQEEHDALLVEVQRLEAELGRVRQDLLGVLGCKGKCEQLATLQETISAQVSSQVRKELQALFYGSGGAGELPESLLLWLSQRYVSTPDLQASLAALEMTILKNVSQQLELQRSETLYQAESQAKLMVQTVTGTVQHAAAAEGLTEEQVKLIVQNALRLYSQDRTGKVDYALESGGGSILSTRCSETYETKTALMSLFGLPLWYFSQSPRVVIQPDVYPGNCWAFKGSQGYLVIRLSLRIRPTSFCLEHIPKALSPTGNITSAPRNFTVHGLDDEYQEEGKLLGHYTYQEDGESLQSFDVMEPNDKTFQIIEVRVLSNWGHPEYTCLYRFRVHGEPRPQ